MGVVNFHQNHLTLNDNRLLPYRAISTVFRAAKTTLSTHVAMRNAAVHQLKKPNKSISNMNDQLDERGIPNFGLSLQTNLVSYINIMDPFNT